MYSAPPIDSIPVRLLTLPKRQQILLAAATVVLLIVPFILTQSLIPLGIILAAAIGYTVIRNPVWSIFAFVVINVVLTLHGKENTTMGAPSVLDLALGLVLALIMAYWILRLRVFEFKSLSTSLGQLGIVLFTGWSVIVSVIGLFDAHNSFNDALREMLNLSPLLILPVIYSRFVALNSRAERLIIAGVLLSAILMVVWNFFRMRSNVLHAVYLYQTGRGNSDLMLSLLLVFIATSLLMTVRRFLKTLPIVLLLLLGLLGVVISMRRNLYIATLICMAGIVWLGDSQERRRGVKMLLVAGFTGVAALIPFYFSSRVFRLLLLNYGLRFLSAQHMGTDLSLLNRYVEWKFEWQNILQSPILGHGFGTQFRTFDIIRHFHSWMGFSHSSYLYMIFKTGFIGAGLFFGAYVAFLAKGLRLLKSEYLTTRSRIILRADIAYLFALLINAYTEPVLDSKTDLIWVSLIWGYFLVLEHHLRATNDFPYRPRATFAL